MGRGDGGAARDELDWDVRAECEGAGGADGGAGYGGGGIGGVTTEEGDGDEAGGFFEGEGGGEGFVEEGRELAEDEGRADVGVPGEGHFGGWGEDAHVGGVGGVGGREDEGGFGVVELSRDGLHCGR